MDRRTERPDLQEAFEQMFGGAKREKLKKLPGDYFQQAIAADPMAFSPRMAFLQYLMQ